MVELPEGAVGAQPLNKRLLIHQQPSQEQLQERLDGAEVEVGVWFENFREHLQICFFFERT